jgi:hypothetical protein
MMVALLLYAYARGNRSSRGIERECREDVAYRIIAANRVPDHSTIAEFRKRHEAGLSELFGEVLVLCREAGLVNVSVIAVDGTKVHANASNLASVDYRQLAEEILAEAARIEPRRTRCMARRGAMSCPSSCAPRRGAAGRSKNPKSAWNASGRRDRFTCRASWWRGGAAVRPRADRGARAGS